MLKRIWLAFVAAVFVCACAAPIVTGNIHVRTMAAVLPRFMALVLPLCCFPAGIAAARDFALDARPTVRALLKLVLSGVAMGGLTLVLSSIVVPAGMHIDDTIRYADSTADHVAVQPAGMTLSALKRALRESDTLTPNVPNATVALRRANHLHWEYQQRLAHAILAPIIMCLSLCITLWTGASTARGDVRIFLLWLAGAATVAVVYASVETSYESAVTAPTSVPWEATWHQMLGIPLTALVALGWATCAVWLMSVRNSREATSSVTRPPRALPPPSGPHT